MVTLTMNILFHQEKRMIKGKTKSGFKYEIDEKILNDYRFFELISEIDDKPYKAPKLVETMLGKEQKDKLLAHVEKDGHVDSKDVMKEIEDIFTNTKELKN